MENKDGALLHIAKNEILLFRIDMAVI